MNWKYKFENNGCCCMSLMVLLAFNMPFWLSSTPFWHILLLVYIIIFVLLFCFLQPCLRLLLSCLLVRAPPALLLHNQKWQWENPCSLSNSQRLCRYRTSDLRDLCTSSRSLRVIHKLLIPTFRWHHPNNTKTARSPLYPTTKPMSYSHISVYLVHNPAP